jgi:chromatin segregation and condensation protein Rec8/ScpA/Scc1 (kleisin family)
LQQLREAQIYKDGVEFLNRLPVHNIDIFSPISSLKKVKNEDAPLKQHDALLLGNALKKVLTLNKEARDLYHVTLESVSIADKMNFVIKFLNRKSVDFKQGATFTEILGESKNSLADTIATFVSLLELAKRQVIRVYQEKQKDDADKIESEEIMIALANGQVELDQNISSEFDEDQENQNETSKPSVANS